MGKKERSKKNNETFEYLIVGIKFVLFSLTLIILIFLVNIAPETNIWINPEICITDTICIPACSFKINELFIVNTEKSFVNFNFLATFFLLCGIFKCSMSCYTFVRDVSAKKGVAPLANFENI